MSEEGRGMTELWASSVWFPKTEAECKGRDRFFAQNDPAEYLNGLLNDPEISRYKADARAILLGALPADGAGTVVDLGCGTGVDLLLLAKEAPPNARLVGVDPGALFLDCARKACAEHKVSESVACSMSDV